MLEQSCIGFPKMTAESRMRDGMLGNGGSGGSRAPEVMMPRRLATVDLAIRRMPAPCRVALEMRYCQEWDADKKPSGAFWRNLNDAHVWIEAALSLARG